MEVRRFLLLSTVGALWVAGACRRGEYHIDDPLSQRAVLLLGPARVVEEADKTATVTLRYVPTAPMAPGELLEASFFGFDTLREAYELQGAEVTVEGWETARHTVPEELAGPYSITVLIDKGPDELWKGETDGNLKYLERNLTNFYAAAGPYEIAMGGFGAANSFAGAAGLRMLGAGFYESAAAVPIDERGALFNMSTDGDPTLNPARALDSAIAWTAAHARHPRRVIFLALNDDAQMPDSSINRLAAKATSAAIRIYTYNLTVPLDASSENRVFYALASKTSGGYLSKSSTTDGYDGLELGLPALHRLQAGGPWYESTFHLQADAKIFTAVGWIRLPLVTNFFNTKSLERNFYYEQ